MDQHNIRNCMSRKFGNFFVVYLLFSYNFNLINDIIFSTLKKKEKNKNCIVADKIQTLIQKYLIIHFLENFRRGLAKFEITFLKSPSCIYPQCVRTTEARNYFTIHDIETL